MSATSDDYDQHGSDSGEMILSKEKCTSSEQNNIVDSLTEDFNSVAILDDMSTCANCGKEGNSNDMNTCNKCKMVKYCNAACKKKHRSKHKKKCDRRVAELHDEALFKEHPPTEECPICMLPIPIDNGQSVFKSCCGKIICHGCIYAMKMSEGKDLCPFCRMPPPSSDEEQSKRNKKLMDNSNSRAFHQFAGHHAHGINGLAQDWDKANELWLKAGELGCSMAYFNLGDSYYIGRGVDMDLKKAKHYYKLAAMMGCLHARHNLGRIEWQAGNHYRSLKHVIIAAKAGHDGSLDVVKAGFRNGDVAKDEYAHVLRAYQARQGEMKSDERDEAAKVVAAMRRRGVFRS